MPFLIAAFETAMAAEAAAAVTAASVIGAEFLTAAAVPELAATAAGAEALGTAGTAAAIPEAAMGINAINPELYASAVNSGAVNPATALSDIPGLAEKLANLQPGEALSNPNALAEVNRFGASPMANQGILAANPNAQITASNISGPMASGAPPAPPAATPYVPAGSTPPAGPPPPAPPTAPAAPGGSYVEATGSPNPEYFRSPTPAEPPGFFDKLSDALSPLQKGFQTAQKFAKENPLATGLASTIASRMFDSGDSMPDTTYKGPLSKFKLNPNFKGRFADPRSFRTAASGGIIDYKEGGTTEKPLVHADMGIAVDTDPNTNKLSAFDAAKKRNERLRKLYGISIPEMQAPTPINDVNVGTQSAAHGGIMQVKRFMEGGGGDASGPGDAGASDAGGGGADVGGAGPPGDTAASDAAAFGAAQAAADQAAAEQSAAAEVAAAMAGFNANPASSASFSSPNAQTTASLGPGIMSGSNTSVADVGESVSGSYNGNLAADVAAAADSYGALGGSAAGNAARAGSGFAGTGSGLAGTGVGAAQAGIGGGQTGYLLGGTDAGSRGNGFDGGGSGGGNGIDSVQPLPTATPTTPTTNIDNLKPKYVNPRDFRSSINSLTPTTDPYAHYKNYNDADYNYLRTPSMPVRGTTPSMPVRNTPPSNTSMTSFFNDLRSDNPNQINREYGKPENFGGEGSSIQYHNLAQGGILGINSQGGMSSLGGYARGGMPRLLDGPGDGMSDNIPATINNRQPARLADGEFVVPADVVSHLGNGSTKAGSKRLHLMMDQVRRARTGNPKQGKRINPDKFMPR